MLQTDTQEHTNSTAMLKLWILESLTFQKAYHSAALITELSLSQCVRSLNLLIQLTECYDIGTSGDHLNVISVSPLISKNNMADMRICEGLVSQWPNLL